MRLVRKLALCAAGAALVSTAAVASPAQAAGSVIDIGYTIQSGHYIKGSGSMTNNGDYTNVCIAIEGTAGGVRGTINGQSACRNTRGSATWSAPDFNWYGWVAAGQCGHFDTRIYAYNNGNRVAAKWSNTVTVCG